MGKFCEYLVLMNRHGNIDGPDLVSGIINPQTPVEARQTFDLLVSELTRDGWSLYCVQKIVAECNVSAEMVGMV
jgi:hypothetical protein